MKYEIGLLYQNWLSMKARCFSTKNPSYKNYGAKGVHVCKGWMVFENFLTDMGTKPAWADSIDRIDPFSGYDCGKCDDCHSRKAKPNCRWATDKMQARNKRSQLRFFYGGRYLLVCELAEMTGLPYTNLASRVRLGWPLDIALSTPIAKNLRKQPRKAPCKRPKIIIAKPVMSLKRLLELKSSGAISTK